MNLPAHPRLVEYVVARIDCRAGVERLVLLDGRADRVLVLAARAWSVLAGADGTRDVDGIVAAASRLGVEVDRAELEGLLAQLDAMGWLVDGVPPALLEGDADRPTAGDDRPIVELQAARYRCDGRGACCRSYGTISFTPRDVHRAAVAIDDDAVLHHAAHRSLLPVHGSAPTVMRAVSLVDGGCRFLEADGACRIHRRGGASAKPVGCQWFPTQVVDDGDMVRAAPAIECACVARPDPAAPPLLPAMRLAELPLGIRVRRLPEGIAAGERRLARADAVALVDRTIDPRGLDAPTQLWALAGALAGVDEPIEPAALAERFAVLARRIATRTDVEATWRGPNDLVVHRLRAVGLGASLLSSPTAVAAVVASEGEDEPLERHVLAVARFLRVPLWSSDAAEAARAGALRMWLARATRVLTDASTDDVTLRNAPLAAVEAVWRVERLGG